MPTPNSSSFTFTVPQPADYRIGALIDGEKWDTPLGFSALLTYSFPWTTSKSATFSGYGTGDYSSLQEPSASEHYGLSSTEQSAFRAALATWSAVANVHFFEVSDTSSSVGDLRIAWTSAASSASGNSPWGWAYLPDASYPSGGDIWLNADLTDTDWSAGSYNFQALVHEIGHTLGLKHTFEGAPVLPAAQDNRLYSVMSYTDAPNSLFVQVVHDAHGQTYWEAWHVEPDSPMLYDIAAMQYLYGANNSYQTGDNTYTFDPHTPFYRTIWDGGGNDTISVANFTLGCTIDLQQGHFSKITILSDSTAGYAWSSAPPTSTYDGSNALAIAYGCVIENAIGGSGDDYLIGNSSSNRLDGGAGNDILEGGAGGHDVLIGGAGIDRFFFHGSADSHFANLEYDTIADLGPDDSLWLIGISGVSARARAYVGSIDAEIKAIVADSKMANTMVFFTDGIDGYEYVNAAGSSFNELFIKLSGKTSAPTLQQLNGIGPNTQLDAMPTGQLKLAGAAIVGHTVVAINTVADADGMGAISYQWYADGHRIDGATATAFTITDAQIGMGISLQASYVDGQGNPELVSSMASGIVQKINTPAEVHISGNLVTGQLLNAAIIDTDGGGGVGTTYLWQSSTDGTNWTSLNSASNVLRLDAGQDGAQIRLTASFTDAHGFAEHAVTTLGPDKSSFLTGTASNDHIQAGAGNDLITGGAGDDALNGGAGLDTAVYAGAHANYAIGQTSPTSGFTILDTVGGDGCDSLVGIERLQFSDANIALDISGNGGKAYRLYQAAFDRTPDLGGVGFWINAMDKGESLNEVAANFVSSQEFKSDYGNNPSNATLVDKFYANVLHRAPDAGGHDYWLGVLDQHQASPAQVLAFFSESPENQAALIGLIGNGFAYTPYHG